MVLLTSSAISGVITAGVVSLFTFLLFLSGYVLQQQTVRSLQDALQQPPPPKPKFSLPPQFQVEDASDVTRLTLTDEATAAPLDVLRQLDKGVLEMGEGGQTAELHLVQNVQKPMVTVDSVHDDQTTSSSGDGLYSSATRQEPFATPPPDAKVNEERASWPLQSAAAFILPLISPAEVCGALLFAQQHTSLSMQKATPIIFLYPSTWETEPYAESAASLDLLRSAIDSPAKDFGHISLHPVQINRVWSKPGMIEGQLLAEIQRTRWEYDRLLYLRLPGQLVDVSSLDWVLQISDLRRYWAPLSTIASSPSSSTLQSPPMLLWSSIRGLVAPRGEMRRLTASPSNAHVSQDKKGTDPAARMETRGSAWVAFDEAEQEHDRSEEDKHGSVLEGFERSRRAICEGTALLPD